jgi:glycosyltransferase involved in cell wall biosynthesis
MTQPTTNRLRVLLVSQHYWPESFRINAVTTDLVRAGCEVTVLTGQPNYPAGKVFEGYRALDARDEVHCGIVIQRVPLVPRGRGGALRLVMNYLSFVLFAGTVGPWRLRRQSFDVIFVYATSPILQAIPAILLKRLKRCALVTWVQDLWPDSLAATGYVKNVRVLAAVERVVRWIYAANDLLLTQSPGFVPRVQALAGATPVHFHPNPADGTDVQGAGAAPVLTLRPGFNLVFAGNMGKAQGLDALLDAAQMLEDLAGFTLVLVGSGQLDDWIAKQVTHRPLKNVHIAGRFAPSAMPGILAQASALLVSLGDDPALELTIPAKVQTYLVAGKPIIAAAGGETARIVQEAGAGLACRAGDARSIANAIRQLHGLERAEREAMGVRGRAYAKEHFDADKLARQLMDRFSEAIRASRSHRS